MMKRLKLMTIDSLAVVIFMLITLPALSTVSAQTSGRADGMRFVPDVRSQFRDLTERADPLGFHIGGSPNPSKCKHYQAITRVDSADGTPYFLLTRSGNTPEVPGPNGLVCDDSDGETGNGHLIVIRMGSRPRQGERLRSNRLRKFVHVDSTPPPLEDRAANYFTIVGGDRNDPDPANRPGLVIRDGEGITPQRVYAHPGGMQLVGNILAIAVEKPRDLTLPPAQIMFFDVSNPEAPVFKSQYKPVDGAGQMLASVGVVALTPLPGGRYLMMATGGEGTTWYFYRSRPTNSSGTDLSSPTLFWDYVGSVPGPEVTNPHQTLQFLREGDINGNLYLAGARGRILSDNDRIDLYRVECRTKDCAPGENIELITEFNGRRVSPFPSTGGTRLANLAAASGFHVTPSGELLFYATEHDNDGPDGTVKAGEWRHINMVRDGSPTLLPTITVDGPHEVDEGSTVSLRGSVTPPITRAWIQLFQELDFGGDDFASLYPVVDFDDYALDDFDNFFFLEISSSLTHNNRARSWKWFAPEGCSIRAIDHGNGQSDPPERRTLVGDGLVHHDPHLSLVLNDRGTGDMDRKIDAVGFLPNCRRHYATPYDLHWDLDVDGSYETTGTLALFNAAHLDGPSVINVPAQARNRSGGPTAEATARVIVRNVKPRVTEFRLVTELRLFDSGGRQLNAQVPFVLTNLPVSVEATFTDPGALDHQTATINWGDGSVEPQTSFRTFNDAFGGATGALSHTHRYTLAGSHQITLSVRDDDGGVGSKGTTLNVITPEQVIEMVIARLDAIIKITSDENVRRNLEQARQALAGSGGRSNDGALHMIRAGNNTAAIDLINQSIASLQTAQAGGAASVITLLEQAVASLSAVSRR
jgi:hypothetical protein